MVTIDHCLDNSVVKLTVWSVLPPSLLLVRFKHFLHGSQAAELVTVAQDQQLWQVRPCA